MSKRGKSINRLASIFLMLLVLSFSSFAGDLLPLQGNVDLSGTPLSSGGLVVEIWDGPDSVASNLVYNSTEHFTGSGNISAGKFDIVLGSVGDELSLEYGRVYYMDLFIDGNDMNFSGMERQVFMSSVGLINGSMLKTTDAYTVGGLNATGDVFLPARSLAGCSGKLTTDASGNLTCAADTGGSDDLTNVVFSNESLLNDTYVRLDDINSSYLLKGENETTGSYNGTYDLWAYNQTGAAMIWVEEQAYLTSESDPLFVNENGSLWLAASDKFNSTYDLWAYNQTMPATSYADANFLTSAMLNESYLRIGQNESLQGSVDWLNVLFINDTVLNETYLRLGENLTVVGWDNVVFTNESILNTTYPRLNDPNTFTEVSHFNANVSIADNLTVGGNTLYVEAVSGRVGIGTTSNIDGKLTILQDSTSNTVPALKIIGSSGDPTGYHLDILPILTSEIDYRFNVKSQVGAGAFDGTVMTLSGTGNVGIGTVAPTHLLNVDGTANITGGSGKQGFVVDGNGQIIIGNPDTPSNSSMLLTISGGDLNVTGAIYYGGPLASQSPFLVQSAEGEPIPICMKADNGNWVGCMPNIQNGAYEWSCAPNRECDEKVLRIEIERKLKCEGFDDEQIGEKSEALKRKFKEGKSLKDIKDEVRAEFGEMQVLDDLDETQLSDNAFDVQSQSTPVDVTGDITALKIQNDALRSEIEALRKEVSELRALLNNSRSGAST